LQFLSLLTGIGSTLAETQAGTAEVLSFNHFGKICFVVKSKVYAFIERGMKDY
jgi:hypothetical protein